MRHPHPREVYAIYPLDENGNIAGVYVGSSGDMENRFSVHLTSRGKFQSELHNLMRQNGFTFQILDHIPNEEKNHIEYDWIDFFSHIDIRLFNERKYYGNHKGNSQNIFGQSAQPYWNGNSVVINVLPNRTRIYPSGRCE